MSLSIPSVDRPEHTVGEHDPIEISSVRKAAQWWPYGTDGTYRLVRLGQLGAIVIGRRRYVTLALLRECLARHTVEVQR